MEEKTRLPFWVMLMYFTIGLFFIEWILFILYVFSIETVLVYFPAIWLSPIGVSIAAGVLLSSKNRINKTVAIGALICLVLFGVFFFYSVDDL